MKSISPQKEVKRPTGEVLDAALKFTEDRLLLLQPLENGDPFSPDWTRWWRTTASGIKEFFGDGSEEYKWFAPFRPPKIIGPESAERKAAREQQEYSEWVRDARTALHCVLDKYSALRTTLSARRDPAHELRAVRAFVSHGGRKPALIPIEQFLRAIGVDPVVVEPRASEGRELNENVDHYRNACDFGIVMWTRDYTDGEDNWLPSGNVIMETGQLRERFTNRVIYLREEGVKLPSMPATLVYESFREDNIGPAFQKIVTELSEWGWLKVSLPGKETPGSHPEFPVAGESPSGDEAMFEVEEGLLDWQVGVEESMESAVEQLAALSGSMQGMSGKISTSNDSLRTLKEQGGKAADIRKQLSVAAAIMVEFTKDVKKRLPPYHHAWHQFEENSSSLLSSVDMTPQDRDSAVETEKRISALVQKTDGAIASMEALKQTVIDLRQKRLSRDLNYACDLTIDSIAKIIEEVSVSRSISIKILNLLDELLKTP